MAHFRRSLVLFPVALTALLVGCGKDSPTSFVNDYSPDFTEAKGTVYEGNYFPIAQGNEWVYNGSMQMDGSTTVKMMGEKQSEPIDESASIKSSIQVNSQTSLSLPGGTYNVFPVVETAVTEDDVSSDETIISRYFETGDDAVYIRAINTADGDIVEVHNPVFIKKPLTVGDSWSAEPFFDSQELLGLSELDFSDAGGGTPDVEIEIDSKFFVVGKEEVLFSNESISTIRLDQKTEISVKMNIPDMGTFNIGMKITSVINCANNIGIVQQKDNGTMAMSGSMSMDGITANISLNSTINTSMVLQDHSLTPSGTIATNDLSTDKHRALGKCKLVDNSDISISMVKAGVPVKYATVMEKAVATAASILF